MLISLANYWSRNKIFAVTIALMRNEGALHKLIDPSIQVLSLCPLKSGPFIFNAVYSFFRLCFLMRGHASCVVLSTLVGTNVIVAAAHYVSVSKFRLVLREACVGAGTAFSIKHKLAKFCYRRADSIVAVSDGVTRELIEKHKLPKSKIVLINNPIDIEGIRGCASGAPPQLGLHSDGPTIIAIGRLVRQKGFDVLLNAFSNVLQSKKCNLVIVGDGPERENLRQQADSLGVSANVALMGVHENPYALLRNASLLVSSSRWEGFPNVILEGMALGRPIIATRCPGVEGSALEQYSLVPMVAVDDPNALAEAILEVLRAPTVACDYTDYLKDFDINQVASRYAAVLCNRL